MLSSRIITEGFAVPGKRLVSLVVGACMGVLAMNTDASAQPRRDAQDVLQLLLDSRELGQYFHFDADPQRVPLRILDASGLAGDAASLTAAGRKVVITKDKDPRALEIRSLVIGPDSAEIRYAFPVEGVTGEGRFVRRDGGWRTERILAHEH